MGKDPSAFVVIRSDLIIGSIYLSSATRAPAATPSFRCCCWGFTLFGLPFTLHACDRAPRTYPCIVRTRLDFHARCRFTFVAHICGGFRCCLLSLCCRCFAFVTFLAAIILRMRFAVCAYSSVLPPSLTAAVRMAACRVPRAALPLRLLSFA